MHMAPATSPCRPFRARNPLERRYPGLRFASPWAISWHPSGAGDALRSTGWPGPPGSHDLEMRYASHATELRDLAVAFQFDHLAGAQGGQATWSFLGVRPVGEFDDLRGLIAEPESLQKLNRAGLDDLAASLGLPADYLSFLGHVGAGDLGSLFVYPRTMSAFEIYPEERARLLEGIVFFGDDGQGFCYGFDLSDGGRVVEVDPKGRIDRSIEPHFAAFLRKFLGAPRAG